MARTVRQDHRPGEQVAGALTEAGGVTASPLARLRSFSVPAPVRFAGRWFVRLLPLAGILGLIASVHELRSFQVMPAVFGVLAWTLGNYVASTLRWRSVSGRGFGFRWYARVFAEGELLGLLTPQHAGALYWRARRLRKAGADCAGTTAELTADRLCTSVTVTGALFVGGSALPLVMQLTGYGVVLAVIGVLFRTRSRWQHRLPTLSPLRLLRWVGYSVLFQVAYVAFVVLIIRAVGVSVPTTSTVGLLAVAQVASILPGVHGAGPKEGVLGGGLIAMGATHTAAFAAVGLLVSLVWIPALLLGGGGLSLRGARLLRVRRKALACNSRATDAPAGASRDVALPGSRTENVATRHGAVSATSVLRLGSWRGWRGSGVRDGHRVDHYRFAAVEARR